MGLHARIALSGLWRQPDLQAKLSDGGGVERTAGFLHPILRYLVAVVDTSDRVN